MKVGRTQDCWESLLDRNIEPMCAPAILSPTNLMKYLKPVACYVLLPLLVVGSIVLWRNK